ncbi:MULTISPECIES: immunity 49 family protein [unclassified Kitasatospora]|uniref:immunity 49 family protein n=1 Tax=unclassified Kitasatospora TaxID=2633591 RepID=UPI00070AA352|nr:MULTISPECIES: immunity 49 family protein [unclassified Kitasatospora]KQV12529.1 hypothetical protein ASC99_34325 [Kitasatospora sp. Root107]KRB73641.1 hypothetical protein ASE03_20770 [Kitasatospora sp. Root187]
MSRRPEFRFSSWAIGATGLGCADGEKFNAALARGLELHREYWAADEDRVEDSNGFVSLPLLAIACLAHHDAGLPVEVESEHLPEHLLLGSWVGEYDA